MEYIEKTLTAIITHNTSSITFTDDFITNESIIDVYFSSDDIVPTNQEQIGNRLIISIEPKNYDVSIAVHITNDDTINYADELESLSDTVESLSDAVDSHTTALSDLASDVDTLENNVDTLENNVDTLENKVDGLNANNINYDEHSTLYSAMGDIDTLETVSKNLVGAINEVKESGGGGGSRQYDNNEKLVGTWFNNNLYEKSYNLDVVGFTDIDTTINTSNIELISGIGSIYNTRYNQWLACPFYYDNTNANCYFSLTNTALRVNGPNISKLKLTIQYIKK